MKDKQKKKEYDHKRYMSIPDRKERQRLLSTAWRRAHGVKTRVTSKELDRRALEWLKKNETLRVASQVQSNQDSA